MLCYNVGVVGVQQNRSPLVNIYFCLPLFLFSKSQKCCINVTAQAILTHCQPILKYISTIPMYRQGTLRIIRLYFRVGGVTHYIYNIRNLLWSLYLISTRGVLTIYTKKDLWENNDLIRSHELFQYIS